MHSVSGGRLTSPHEDVLVWGERVCVRQVHLTITSLCVCLIQSLYRKQPVIPLTTTDTASRVQFRFLKSDSLSHSVHQGTYLSQPSGFLTLDLQDAAVELNCSPQWHRGGAGALGPAGDPACSCRLRTMKPDSAPGRLEGSHAQLGINILCRSQ